jgi:hypothetical protein
MSKFFLNLHLQISKALVNSKIQFLIQNYFPTQPRPTSSPPVRPSRPIACSACPIRPSPAPLVRFGRRLLRFSDSVVASLSLIGGPTLSVSPGLSPSSDNARAATAPRLPSTAQLHASGAAGPLPPRLHFSSLNPLLNPPPSLMALKPLTPVLNSQATPPRRSPDPL